MIILQILLGSFFLYAGGMHFYKPTKFNLFIPDFLPKKIVNYIVGFLEISIGIGLLIPSTTKNAALLMFLLMLLFLPLHLLDVFKTKPIIGSKKAAYIRVFIQFLLLYFAYLIYSH